MTVCISSICQEKKEQRLILCSDTRLVYTDIGSTNTTVKIDILGYGFCVQLAGEWSGISYFSSLLKTKIQKSPHSLTDIKGVESEVRSTISKFLGSSLYHGDEVYQMLLSGFIKGSAIIFDISIIEGVAKLYLRDSFGAIGSGSTIASILLRLREYHSSMPLPYATYLVYEAKRASEKEPTVGSYTTLAVQAPGPDMKDRAYLRIMGETGKAHLEAVYSGLWRIPFAEIPEFRDDFFIDPTAKQSPQ
jgi:hypothetical protein